MFHVRDFIFSRFNTKRLDRGIKYAHNISNLHYLVNIRATGKYILEKKQHM